MYKKFYLMQKEPFDCHPSPDLFYKSKAHKNCWNYLAQGIKRSDPILLVSGEYGSGKTLLSLKLIKALKKNKQTSVYISTPTYSFPMLLEKIIVELKIAMDEIDTSDELKLQNILYEYFEKNMIEERKKKFVYLVIDDAQEFSYSYLTKLRLFASYNYLGYFPIRIILFAHKNFLETLNHPQNIALGQRIKRIYCLDPFDFEDIKEYIYFRLIHSGASGKPVFDDEAISVIETISNGNPRLINNICDNCLLSASNQKLNLIDQSMVNQTIAKKKLVGIKNLQKPRTAQFSYEKPSHAYIENPLSEDEEFRDKDMHAEITQAGETGEDLSGKKPPKKIDLKNLGSRYGKKGFIIILILIILFLSAHIFNQNKSYKISNLQNNSNQTIYPAPAYNYVDKNQTQ
ncbi:ExeA family protein [Desulfobacula phenolica]|uniref:Type II secretory pathway, component ExeA (Predicted ATPase) n=1 Tax=Desulfobacula phenolica TaxID=90732 RepID=A0A1H2DTL1_9BACT|nr:AAA family ATPase [Desulfobacula phenolica]SDT86212.1 Type II secretory pathway, component ExeA (predicted ATPase) [Desulfobacula phenolica]